MSSQTPSESVQDRHAEVVSNMMEFIEELTKLAVRHGCPVDGPCIVEWYEGRLKVASDLEWDALKRKEAE